jgi:hypothetical protein
MLLGPQLDESYRAAAGKADKDMQTKSLTEIS